MGAPEMREVEGRVMRTDQTVEKYSRPQLEEIGGQGESEASDIRPQLMGKRLSLTQLWDGKD